MSRSTKRVTKKTKSKKTKSKRATPINAVDVEIFRHLFTSVAEEMGVVLRATAFSPNIKERLDLSCAVTDANGDMIAQASHIPVHLGSCHLTAKEVLRRVDLEPGDVVMLNDPFQGGTHLPDVTLFAPVFLDGRTEPDFHVLTRAHHADVGGGVPGSMGDFDEIYKEGIVVPPVKLCSRGELVEDVMAFFLANVRTPRERRGDLTAQRAATEKGVARLIDLARRYDRTTLRHASDALLARSAKAMRGVVADIPDGTWTFEDRLDGAGTAQFHVTVTVKGDRLKIDFTGTSPQIAGSMNAHRAITLSSVFYCVRCLADESVPTNSGCLEPVDVVIPEGSVVGAVHPAATAGGNVETSQRIVDVVFGALAQALPGRVPAASQGTMNNLSLGGRHGDGTPFTYFETIAGGVGASASGAGASGVHSHMTNTLNTPIEALEIDLPLRVTAYELRRRSGGNGRHKGGDGVVREVEVTAATTATILSTRRADGPTGAAGGESGRPGKNAVVKGGRKRAIGASETVELEAGDRIRIETPGGGGYGKKTVSRAKRGKQAQ